MKRNRDKRQATNCFCIAAFGEEFDVDRYLQRYRLPVDLIWHRGEPVVVREGLYVHSGFNIDLGMGPELDPSEQQPIAVNFLMANQVSLKKLRTFPGVTSFYLGLHETVYPNSAGSVMDFSPALMKIALKVGIEVAIWACLSPTPYPVYPKSKKK